MMEELELKPLKRQVFHEVKFTFSRYERFIDCLESEKSFSQKMSEERFNEVVANKCFVTDLGDSLKIPSPFKKEGIQLLNESLVRMERYFHEYVCEERQKAFEEVNLKTGKYQDWYKNTIEKRRCQDFLEKENTSRDKSPEN